MAVVTFSSRMSSAAKETGLSMVKIVRTWSKSNRFCRLETQPVGGEIKRILTVLQNITDNTKLIKVSTTTLRAEGFLEGDLNITDVVLVPCGTKCDVCKAKHKQILDHLFTQIVINTEGLVLGPPLLNTPKKLAGRFKVLSKGFLNDDAVDTSFRDIALFFDVLGDGNEDSGGKRKVEDAVALLGLIMRFDFFQMLVEVSKRLGVFISPCDVRERRLERFDLVLELGVVL